MTLGSFIHSYEVEVPMGKGLPTPCRELGQRVSVSSSMR